MFTTRYNVINRTQTIIVISEKHNILLARKNFRRRLDREMITNAV